MRKDAKHIINEVQHKSGEKSFFLKEFLFGVLHQNHFEHNSQKESVDELLQLVNHLRRTNTLIG